MRTLIISAAFPPLRGGESDHMLHLSTRLAEQGLEVAVLTVKGSEDSASLPFKVYPIMRDWSWADLPRFVKVLRDWHPNAILLKYSGWIYNDHPMITFAPTVSKFLLPRCRFVTQFGFAEASFPERKSRLVRAIRKAVVLLAGAEQVDYHFGTLLRDSDTLISLGELYTAKLLSQLPAASQKIVLIPPPPILHIVPQNGGASRKRGREMLGLGDDDFLFAYFGVIYRSKGIETLLRAFQQITQEKGAAKLALIGGQSSVIDGSSYYEEICALSRQLGIEDKIVAREYEWDSSDGSFYLNAADACVLPFDDGVTLIRSSVAGAAAHGLPIITTKGLALETPFIHGKNVFLCEPKNPKSLATAMEAIISGPELRQRLRRGACEISRDWFSWDKALSQTMKALEGRCP